MAVYVDSSVVLRVVLGQADRLADWDSIDDGVASALLEVECLRTIDRLRVNNPKLSADSLVVYRSAVFRIVEALQIVDVSPPVLRRASQPMATPLGTLDAIHLATAQMWRETFARPLIVATHDRALGLAAQADGFTVTGV